jgi:hypothetical protein
MKFGLKCFFCRTPVPFKKIAAVCGAISLGAQGINYFMQFSAYVAFFAFVGLIGVVCAGLALCFTDEDKKDVNNDT